MHLSKRCIILGHTIREEEGVEQVGTHTIYMGTCFSSKRKGLLLDSPPTTKVPFSADSFINVIDFKPPLIFMDNPSLLRLRLRRKRKHSNSNKRDRNKLSKLLPQWLPHNSKLNNNMPHNSLNSITGNTRT